MYMDLPYQIEIRWDVKTWVKAKWMPLCTRMQICEGNKHREIEMIKFDLHVNFFFFLSLFIYFLFSVDCQGFCILKHLTSSLLTLCVCVCVSVRYCNLVRENVCLVALIASAWLCCVVSQYGGLISKAFYRMYHFSRDMIYKTTQAPCINHICHRHYRHFLYNFNDIKVICTNKSSAVESAVCNMLTLVRCHASLCH